MVALHGMVGIILKEQALIFEGFFLCFLIILLYGNMFIYLFIVFFYKDLTHKILILLPLRGKIIIYNYKENIWNHLFI